jgi:hypothetical protein
VDESRICATASTIASQWLTSVNVVPTKAQVALCHSISLQRRRVYFVACHYLTGKTDYDMSVPFLLKKVENLRKSQIQKKTFLAQIVLSPELTTK